MKYLFSTITTALDFLFPPNALDVQMARTTPEELGVKVRMENHAPKKASIILFDYNDPLIKHMIWTLKYKKNRRAATLFSEVLREVLVEELSDHVIFSSFENPLLIPIPLSKKRLRERGFNQMDLVGKNLVVEGGGTWLEFRNDILEKVKETPPQTTLKNRKERINNLSGAFQVRNEAMIQGHNALLLDDVTTTGSTLTEARRVLLNAGARNVITIALAH
jgi:competence protein ComFC